MNFEATRAFVTVDYARGSAAVIGHVSPIPELASPGSAINNTANSLLRGVQCRSPITKMAALTAIKCPGLVSVAPTKHRETTGLWQPCSVCPFVNAIDRSCGGAFLFRRGAWPWHEGSRGADRRFPLPAPVRASARRRGRRDGFRNALEARRT